MFDHALEKSKWPQFKYEEKNIILCKPEEHIKKTMGFPMKKHMELIEKIKEELL